MANASFLTTSPIDRASRAAGDLSAPTPAPEKDLSKSFDTSQLKPVTNLKSAEQNLAIVTPALVEATIAKDGLERDLSQQQATLKAEQARAEAEAYKRLNDQIAGSDEKKRLEQSELELAAQKFQTNTPEHKQDALNLASAIGIMGAIIGGGARKNAALTLAGMNGMMEGIKQGDLERYKREKQNFDNNIADLTRKNQLLTKQFERVVKLATTDKEESYLQAQQMFAEHNAQGLKEIYNKYGAAAAFKSLTTQKAELEKVVEKFREREARAEQARLQAGLREPKVVGTTPEGYGVYLMPDGTEKVGTTKLTPGKKGAGISPVGLGAAYKEATGVDLPPKDVPVVRSNIEGVRAVEDLMTTFKDPEVVKGVAAKLSPFFEKLNSLVEKESGKKEEEKTDFSNLVNQTLTSDDKTTLALKKALLLSYVIERASAGTNRVTVQQMKQSWPVLDPTNYTPQAYYQLLEDRRKEMYGTLYDLGVEPQLVKKLATPPPYEPYTPGSPTQPASPTKPSESDGWSVKEK